MSKRPQPQPKSNVVHLPVGGAQGRLTTKRGDQLPVRVFERGEGILMLVLLVRAGIDLRSTSEQLRAQPGASAVLEYISPRGLARFRGDAVLTERDVIRFTITDEPELIQRRQYVRVESAQPVEITTGEDGAKPLKGHAIDISGGGMQISGISSLKLGEIVGFRLELEAGAPPLEGDARVVRADGSARAALAFEGTTSEDLQRLIHFVFDRQRAARAKTRDAGNWRRA